MLYELDVEKKRFYSPEDVAEMLKLNVRTIYRWIKSGKLAAINHGSDKRGVWKIRGSEIIKFHNEV